MHNIVYCQDISRWIYDCITNYDGIHPKFGSFRLSFTTNSLFALRKFDFYVTNSFILCILFLIWSDFSGLCTNIRHLGHFHKWFPNFLEKLSEKWIETVFTKMKVLDWKKNWIFCIIFQISIINMLITPVNLMR